MIQILDGLYRIEEKPHASKYWTKIHSEDYKGNPATKEEYKEYEATPNARKLIIRVKEKIPIYDSLQQLWRIKIDSNGDRKWVFATYAKSEPLFIWNTYPVYTGPIFSRR